MTTANRGESHGVAGLASLTRSGPTVAFFGDASGPRPLGIVNGVDLATLVRTLGAIDPYGPARHRMRALSAAAATAAEEAASLRLRLGRHDVTASDPSIAQQYFRLRTAALPSEWSLWHCLNVISASVDDLVEAPVSGSDIDRIVRALVATLRSYTSAAAPVRDASSSDADTPTLSEQEMWWHRWIIGHQLHALLNVHAAWGLAEAVEHLRCDDWSAAQQAIDSAAQIVEGFASARALALAVPATFYQQVLRPTMLPPLTAQPLTGRMHVEYRGYQARLRDLLDHLPQTSADLASAHPMLTMARERLVEADLIESERHVTTVEPLVGDSRSLIQNSKSTENAVSALRRIRHERARRAAPYVRFPDTTLAHEARDATCLGGDVDGAS